MPARKRPRAYGGDLRPERAGTSPNKGSAPKVAPHPLAPPGRGIWLVLPEPPSANRYWRNFRGRMVLSAEGRAYKAAVQGRPGRCLAGPVAVTLTWYRSRKAGDLDNRVKIVLDALQGVAYANDGQVVRLLAVRAEDKHNPRVVVTVTRMEAHVDG